MGLGDTRDAVRDAATANLYFRIAAGLERESADFHAAAVANAELTDVQLNTLHTEIAAASNPRPTAIALRPRGR